MNKIIKRDYPEASKFTVLYEGAPVDWKQLLIDVPATGDEVVLQDVPLPAPEKPKKVKPA